MHGIRALWLNAYYLARGSQSLHDICDTANQSATPDRHDNGVEIVALLTDLETDNAGARRDGGPLERVHEIPPFVVPDSLGNVEGLIDVIRSTTSAP